MAVLLRPDAVRVRRADQTIRRAREVAELVSSARGRPLTEAVVDPGRAQEWVEAIRADRDR